METIKAINQCTVELAFFALTIAAMAWCGVGIVEAIKFAVKKWFKSGNRRARRQSRL
jgi:hypothetical protein